MRTDGHHQIVEYVFDCIMYYSVRTVQPVRIGLTVVSLPSQTVSFILCFRPRQYFREISIVYHINQRHLIYIKTKYFLQILQA